ncbi:hypothetical protein DFH11DRAFT_11165 [Phellopilus nigrolimitatus]|nr:hypothetical protein DFH11DRAFT_11165 [Phellopilus nigrolimitatus]
MSLTSNMRDILRGIADVAEDIKWRTGTSASPSSHATTAIESDTLLDYLPALEPIVSQLTSTGIEIQKATRLSDAFVRAGRQLQHIHVENTRKLFYKFQKMGKFTSFQQKRILDVDKKLYLDHLSQWKDNLLQKAFAAASASPSVKAAHDKAPVYAKTDNKGFNHNFVSKLECYFSGNQFPSKEDKITMAKKSGMSYRQIHVWFQNRRNRAKTAAQNSQLNNGNEVSPQTPISLEDTDVKDKDAPFAYSSRSSSFTLVDNDEDNIFECMVPSYAFPETYPPVIRDDSDPFPCRFGDFSHFHKPCWDRTPATSPRPQNEISITTLVLAFERLHIDDADPTPMAEISRLPWGLYVPAKKSGCDVTLPYTVRPLRAPLFSFIRSPASCGTLGPCKDFSGSSSRRDDPSLVDLTLKVNETVKSSCLSRRRPPPTARVSFGSSSQISSDALQVDTSLFSSSSGPSSSSVAPALTPPSEPLLKGKRASRKKPDSKGCVPTRRGKGKAKAKTATHSQPSIPFSSSSLSSSDTSSRSPSFDSDSSLPALCYSSSSSSASSDTHSPVIPLQSLPEEKPLPQFHSFGGADTSLLLPPAQSLLESLPPPVFPSDDNSFPFDFSKGPLDYTFNYDLPPYPTFSQPLDGFSQGLHFSPFFATPAPLSFDFNAISV